MNHTPPVETTI